MDGQKIRSAAKGMEDIIVLKEKRKIGRKGRITEWKERYNNNIKGKMGSMEGIPKERRHITSR